MNDPSPTHRPSSLTYEPAGRSVRGRRTLGWIVRATALVAVTLAVGTADHGLRPAGSTVDPAAQPWRSWQPGIEPKGPELRGPQLAPADWFMRQRAFPYDAVPEPARRKAFADAAVFAELAAGARGVAWQLAGPTNIGGRITDIAMSQAMPQRIFIGTADGGIFRSTDDGASWTPIFDHGPSLSIGDVTVDPSNPDVVYVGTGEPNAAGDTYAGSGVYRSINGGDTWESLGLPESGKIGRIIVDPVDPQRVFVAVLGRLYGTNPERGVYRTTNGGTSWDHVLFVNDSTGVVDIVQNPDDPDQLFAAAWERVRRPHERNVGGFSSGIYTSDDGGDTWQSLGAAHGLPAHSSTGGRIGLSLCAADPSVIYAVYCNHPGSFVGVYKTTNGGTSWSRVDNGSLGSPFNGFGWYFGQIRVDPTDPDRVFVLGVPLHRSTNGGVSWSSVGSGVHVDHHAMLIDPSDPDRILLGNDGGFYQSGNGGGSGSWAKSLDLPISQFYAVTVDHQAPWRIYGGTQDNSTMRTWTGSLDDWDIIYGGDGFYTLIDPTNSNIVYAEYQYGGLSKSLNAGGSWSSATSGIPGSDRRNWSTPVVMDPSDNLTLYYGTYRVFRTTNGAGNWSPISNDLTNGDAPGNLVFGTITTIDVATTDPDHLLAGTDDGNVWITTNGGGSWTLVSASLPDRWVTRVAFDPTDESVAYVTLSGYRLDEELPHVYRTDDSGASWTSVSSNLPGIPLNDVIVDPANPAQLYVAADAGVYWSANTGDSWQPLGVGLPPVAVHDLHLHAPTRTLVAGTHGRSAYTFALDDLVSTVDMPPSFQPIVAVGPNPTSHRATFEVHVVVDGRITLELFDVQGRLVRVVSDGHRDAGIHEIPWDGRDRRGEMASAGVYFYRVRTSAGPVVGQLVVRR